MRIGDVPGTAEEVVSRIEELIDAAEDIDRKANAAGMSGSFVVFSVGFYEETKKLVRNFRKTQEGKNG